MEKINYRFLNYKRYSKFLEDLNDPEGSKIREDAIVFIQDKSRIWARNTEYRCSGPEDVIINGNTISFVDEMGNNTLTISLEDGTLTFTNADGDISSVRYALKSELDQATQGLDILQYLTKNEASSTYATIEELSAHIEEADRKYVTNTNVQSTYVQKSSIDDNFSTISENPVQNKVITSALGGKVNTSIFNDFQQQNTHSLSSLQQQINEKQNLLNAGTGIIIDNNTISVTSDACVYILVSELPTENIREDKVYLLESVENGKYSYIEYRYKNGQWSIVGEKIPEIYLDDYLKITIASQTYLTKTDAQNIYQPKGSYLTQHQDISGKADISSVYTKNEADLKFLTESSLGEYLTKSDAESTYARKEDALGYITSDRLNDYVSKDYFDMVVETIENALIVLLQVIDDKYVLKKDVYTATEKKWSQSDITDFEVDGVTYFVYKTMLFSVGDRNSADSIFYIDDEESDVEGTTLTLVSHEITEP